jgi:hypothetical protein
MQGYVMLAGLSAKASISSTVRVIHPLNLLQSRRNIPIRGHDF